MMMGCCGGVLGRRTVRGVGRIGLSYEKITVDRAQDYIRLK
jgi:hypothetical protein